MITKETVEKIFRLTNQLSPKQRWIFYWRLVNGDTYESIGQRLSMTRQGVKDHYDKSLDKITSESNK